MKFLKIVLLFLAFLSVSKAEELIKIGSSPHTHLEILKVAEPLLLKEGYKLEISEFTDGVQPNLAVEQEDLDANFFQHTPFLNEFNKEQGTNLVPVAKVHIELMGVYSSKHSKSEALKNNKFSPAKNSLFSIPNDPTNEARALRILQNAGLIKLSKGELATTFDIASNPLNLEFSEIKVAQQTRSLQDVDYAVILGGYARIGGLKPSDALILEDEYSPYTNVLVVKKGNENSPKTQALIKVLHSKEVKDFINEKYQGSVLAVF